MNIYNLTIDQLTYEGYGALRKDDKLILVENALIGENVDVFIYKKTKKIYYAKVINFNTKAANRIIEDSILLQSGAALISNISYQDQLNFKNEYISYLFKRNLDVIPCKIIPSDKQWNYRNKITAFCKILDKKITFFLKKKNSNELIRTNEFILAYQEINNLLNKLNEYEWDFDKDIINSITIRSNHTQDQFQILFEIDKKYPKLINQIKNIFKLDLNIKSIGYKYKNKIESVYENGFEMNIDQYKFNVDLNSFFQINIEQTLKIYTKIKQFIEAKGAKNILDLFCGVGSIGIFVTKDNLTGVEIVSQAIENAKINAIKNGVKSAKFISENEADLDIDFSKFDFIILDPPRLGVSSKNIRKINQSKVKYIAYLSCDIRTQVRDLKQLSSYRIIEVIPYDMFPQTPHIESLCFLEKIEQ